MVVSEHHAHDLFARAELGQVKSVGRAGIDDELHHARRLLLREPRAVRRGGDLVLRAGQDQRGHAERRASYVGAWRVKSSRRVEAGRAAGRDLERSVTPLRKPDRRDPRSVDVGKAGQIGEKAIGIGQGLLEVDEQRQCSSPRRGAKSSTNRAT